VERQAAGAGGDEAEAVALAKAVFVAEAEAVAEAVVVCMYAAGAVVGSYTLLHVDATLFVTVTADRVANAAAMATRHSGAL